MIRKNHKLIKGNRIANTNTIEKLYNQINNKTVTFDQIQITNDLTTTPTIIIKTMALIVLIYKFTHDRSMMRTTYNAWRLCKCGINVSNTRNNISTDNNTNKSNHNHNDLNNNKSSAIPTLMPNNIDNNNKIEHTIGELCNDSIENEMIYLKPR